MSWRVIVATILFIGILLEATGFPLMLSAIRIFSGWLQALPPPTEHFASMLGDLGWPLAALWTVWLLRRPLSRAAFILSERMRGDNLKFGGFLEITATDFNTMDRKAAAEHVEVEPVGQAVDIAESLLEYAGISDNNARALLNWIEATLGTSVDPEAFLTEPEFADARQQAYMAFVGG